MFVVQAEQPGAALPVEEKIIKKINSICLNLFQPQTTHKCPHKISANSVQPFGRLHGTVMLIRSTAYPSYCPSAILHIRPTTAVYFCII